MLIFVAGQEPGESLAAARHGGAIMAKAKPSLALSPSRDIPLHQLFLSPANVRRVPTGDAIASLADDIARRGLLQGLDVRPELDGEGQETGRFEIPAADVARAAEASRDGCSGPVHRARGK